MPDGLVGYSSLTNRALLFIAACTANRCRQSKQKTCSDEWRRTRARDRLASLGEHIHLQACLLEARGGASSLPLAERNNDADHIRRAQRNRR